MKRVPLWSLHWQAARASDVDAMLHIEQQAYPHPWSRANFDESLASGYRIQTLWSADPKARADAALLGYCVAMKGFDEAHLLNITVTPAHQGSGFALHMLADLCRWAEQTGLHWLWLEVRVSNARALAVYERFGFNRVGLRNGYYPASRGSREDAVVMSLSVNDWVYAGQLKPQLAVTEVSP